MFTHRTSLRIFCGTLAIMIFFSLAVSCKRQEASVAIEPASAVVDRYFQALQRNDYDTANSCLDGGEQCVFAMTRPSGTQLDAIYAQLLKHLDYKMLPEPTAVATMSAKKSIPRLPEGAVEQVTVMVTALNVPVLFDNTMTELSQTYAKSLANISPIPSESLESRLYLMMAESMVSDTVPCLTGTLKVQVKHVDGEWRIVADKTLYNAVTGNVLQIVGKAQEWKPKG